jgi:hypothetical protein
LTDALKSHKGLTKAGAEKGQEEVIPQDSENPELEEAYKSYGIQLPQERSMPSQLHESSVGQNSRRIR